MIKKLRMAAVAMTTAVAASLVAATSAFAVDPTGLFEGVSVSTAVASTLSIAAILVVPFTLYAAKRWAPFLLRLGAKLLGGKG